MPSDIDLGREIKQELDRISGENRTALDGYRREMVAAKTAATESKVYSDALFKAADDRIATLQETVDELSTIMNRTGTLAASPDAKAGAPLETAHSRAFERYLRRGKDGLDAAEIKALHEVGSDPQGGYLCSPQVMNEIMRTAREASPLRRLARIITTDKGSLEFPRQINSSTAYWVGETEERSETSISWGSSSIPVHELACYTDVTLRLLEDADFDITRIISQDLGEGFAVEEGKALLTGDQIKKPLGLLNTSGVTAVPTGDAATILPDALISLVYSLPARFHRGAVFVMSTATASIIRRMKDAGERYLWQDGNSGVVQGQPGTLLGFPVELSDEMPAVASNSFPVVFGNFEQALWILQRANGLSIVRDDFTLRGSGKIRLHARQRLGAGFVRPEAVVKLRVSAS